MRSCVLRSSSRFPVRLPRRMTDMASNGYSMADTEIDWKAYMEQVAQYLAGERDYTAIKGGTGPLVYPAGHVYIYSFLYEVTDRGRNILRAQWLFAGLYLATLLVVMLCYREARVTLPLGPLHIRMSKCMKGTALHPSALNSFEAPS